MKEGVKYGFGVSYTDLGKIEGRGFWNGDELNLKQHYGMKYHPNGQVFAMGLSLEDRLDPDMPQHKQGILWFKSNGCASLFTNKKIFTFNEKLSGAFVRHNFLGEIRENIHENSVSEEHLDLRSRTLSGNYEGMTTRIANISSTERNRLDSIGYNTSRDSDHRGVDRNMSIILGR